MPDADDHRPEDTPAKSVNKSFREVAPYLTIGMQLALAVLLFFFIGWWLDSTYGTSPWGRLGGVTVGSIGGMIKFIRTVTSSAFNAAGKDKKA